MNGVNGVFWQNKYSISQGEQGTQVENVLNDFMNVATPGQSELAGDSEKGEKAVRKKFGTFSKSFSTILFLRKSKFFKRLIKIKHSECHLIGIRIAPYLK